MDGKFWRENGNENFFRVYLVRWEEREINGRVGCFLPEPTKKFSLQNGEKTDRILNLCRLQFVHKGRP